jgi:hypothetical protein
MNKLFPDLNIHLGELKLLLLDIFIINDGFFGFEISKTLIASQPFAETYNKFQLTKTSLVFESSIVELSLKYVTIDGEYGLEISTT